MDCSIVWRAHSGTVMLQCTLGPPKRGKMGMETREFPDREGERGKEGGREGRRERERE